MHSIDVRSEHDYQVIIDCNWKEQLINSLGTRSRVAFIFSNRMKDVVKAIEVGDCEAFYFEVADGEDAKTYQTLNTLWNWLGASGFTRSDLIIGVGGGTITDLAGFTAATWLRGIDWIAVPTTLAGMVDAAIGGKTGINSDYGKNLIGSFHSPQQVIVDISWLQSLSDRDYAAGLAEVVKTGFIAQPKILDLLNDRSLESIRTDDVLISELISLSVAAKASVVSADFKESFDREILNYGHTLGHAVEIHSKYSLRHGEAVSIGLCFIAQLAGLRGILDEQTVNLHQLLLKNLGLPVTYSRSAWQELFALMALDKKARGHNLRFVAISKVGECLRIEDAIESELEQAYEMIST